MATIAGAFSGLISFGVFQIHHRIAGWKYLFIIEGGGTILLATFALWWLPHSGPECHWFTEAEKQATRLRLLQDGSNLKKGNGSAPPSSLRLEIKKILDTIFDRHIIAWALCCFCYGVAQNSVSNF